MRARARARIGVDAQPGCAARAAPTARSTSAAADSGTRARSSPVAGLRETSTSSELGLSQEPPMKLLSDRRAAGASTEGVIGPLGSAGRSGDVGLVAVARQAASPIPPRLPDRDAGAAAPGRPRGVVAGLL